MPETVQFREQQTDVPVFSEHSKDRTVFGTIDQVENGDIVENVFSKANPARPGFTRHDQKDMYRMGKTQRLQVQLTISLLLQH